jgi:hypothetical protein
MDHLDWQCYFGKDVGYSDRAFVLPWPPWAALQEIETILSVSNRQGGQGTNSCECHLLLLPALLR